MLAYYCESFKNSLAVPCRPPIQSVPILTRSSGIATPIGIFLAFKLGYGLYGLWAGLALALTLAGLAELAMVFSMNWSQFGQDCDLESLSP